MDSHTIALLLGAAGGSLLTTLAFLVPRWLRQRREARALREWRAYNLLLR